MLIIIHHSENIKSYHLFTIKYTTVKDVEGTIKNLERLYKTKKYPHKSIHIKHSSIISHDFIGYLFVTLLPNPRECSFIFIFLFGFL